MMPAINISPTGFQMLGFLYSHQECEGHQKTIDLVRGSLTRMEGGTIEIA